MTECDGTFDLSKYDRVLIEKANCIVQQFKESWHRGSIPARYEAQFLMEQCENMLKKHDDDFNKLCSQFDGSGRSLLQITKTVFDDKVNWGRLISVFTFGTKLMNKIPSNLLTEWLIYVILQCNQLIIL